MSDHADAWEAALSSVDRLRTAIAKSKAANVNATALREHARAAVQYYFRVARPHVVRDGVLESELAQLDDGMQILLRLSQGPNRKASYAATIKVIRDRMQALRGQRELSLSRARSTQQIVVETDFEKRVISALRVLTPTAADSYQQAILDIQSTERLSYRGTAHELRECLRDVLDRLSPDDAVSGAPGFKLEQSAKKPTQKQKVRFLLKARGLSTTAIGVPEETLGLVDAKIASLTRATYERGSVSAHVSATRQEVRQLKSYLDTLLAELLQLHQ